MGPSDDATDSGSGSGDDSQRGRLGRYAVLERIGVGGMGVVHRAWDPQLNRAVALKLLRGERERTVGFSEGRQRIAREARALARLSHPNVVPVYDVGEFGGQTFLTMELVDGQTLDQWMRARMRPWRETVGVFIEAGRGLAAAHAVGLVHRDFKPSNVLIGNDGRVRVMDFGLATPAGGKPMTRPIPMLDHRRSADTDGSVDADGSIDTHPSTSGSRLTMTGRVMGTPAYMSPEQHYGDPPDALSDQYSFCVALFQGLWGHRPFEGANDDELCVAKEAGPPVSRADRPVPRWLRAVVDRGLTVEPLDRWPSMAALIDALDRNRRVIRQPWVKLAAVASGAVAIAALSQWSATDAQDRCQDVVPLLRGVWDADRRVEVAGAFDSSGVPYAASARERVARGLDEYVGRWSAAHQEICRSEASAEMDRQMACLRSGLREVGALTEVLASADRDVVGRAIQAVTSLPAPEQCKGEAPGWEAPTRDPSASVAIDAIEDQLARARALARAGKYHHGAAQAEAAVRAASALSLPGLRAKALLVHGQLVYELGDYDSAGKALSESLWTATAAGDDLTAAQSATDLVRVEGTALLNRDEALVWARHGEAAIARAGLSEGLPMAALLNARGAMYYAAGDPAAAASDHERAIEILERVADDNHPELSRALLNLGNAQATFAAARPYYERALAIDERLLGPDHPGLAPEINNLALVYDSEGDYPRAIKQLERAISLVSESGGPDHPDIAMFRDNLGGMYQRLGDFEAARVQHERAIAIYEGSSKPNLPAAAGARANLAVVLDHAGHHQAAVDEVERALASLTRTLGADHIETASALVVQAEIFAEHDRPGEAEAALLRALAILDKTLGPEHPDYAVALTTLGFVTLAQDQPTRARRSFERAIELLEAGGSPPSEIAYALAGLGHVHVELGNLQQAEAALRRSLALGQISAVDSRMLGEAKLALAKASLQNGGRRSEAVELAQQALQLFESDSLDDDADDARTWLARHR